MRLIGTILSAFILLALVVGGASPLPQASDPIFGLKYDSLVVKFEPAPAQLYTACKELMDARLGRKLWIFARTGNPNDQYVVVGGYYLKRDSNGHVVSTMTDPVGALVRLKGDRCELIDPPRELFDYPEANAIAIPTLRELAKDAVCRYSRAFGSKTKFLEAMQRQRIRLDDARSSALKEAVSASPNVCR